MSHWANSNFLLGKELLLLCVFVCWCWHQHQHDARALERAAMGSSSTLCTIGGSRGHGLAMVLHLIYRFITDSLSCLCAAASGKSAAMKRLRPGRLHLCLAVHDSSTTELINDSDIENSAFFSTRRITTHGIYLLWTVI